MLSLRCGAKTRRGTDCLSPAVRGKRRCRMHGGAKGSGAPQGSQNAFKHGCSTAYAKNLRRRVKLLISEYHALFGLIGVSDE
jgi:hypothetical protein